ncbi:MAG: pmmB [Frankiales bacterium]|nr:pmmB [Frankiales bacterium]
MSGYSQAEVEDWIRADPSPTDAAELIGLLKAAQHDSASAAELADRFSGPLTFGTAGLRGPLRAGPNGMNTAVVRRAASGVARYLTGTHLSGNAPEPAAGRVVVIGYDARHGSRSFAADSAAVFAAAGFDARLLPRPLPTPVLAFAVRALGAVAGVMVTASHNPPQDNGYKVYAGDGAQIVPPMDSAIEAEIAAVGPTQLIGLTPLGQTGGPTLVAESLIADYVESVAALAAAGSPRRLRIVHTSLHGVGSETLQAVLAAAGFDPAIEVPEQAEPDPDFPTVAFPNPEEPGAMDLALRLAAQVEADLIIANDPDADRCAVGVPAPGDVAAGDAASWRMLSGDEVGVLLADSLMRAGKVGTYATTIVSSTMLSALAAARGLPYVETLTGFKWIARAAEDLVYGYEEALGYAVAPQLVRDKDGISAALAVAELAAALKARGSTLTERLAELSAEFGQHRTRQLSWRVADPAVIATAMRRLRSDPVAILLGLPVTSTDLAPDNDVLTLSFDGGRVVIRPSGTEPKCKAYLELSSPAGSALDAADLGARLDRLGAEVTAALGWAGGAGE